MSILPPYYQKYKLLNKWEKVWYLDLSGVTMNIVIDNTVASLQLYHNTKWNIIFHQVPFSEYIWLPLN